MLHCSGLSTQLALGCLGPASKHSKSSRVLIAIDYVFTSCLLPRRKRLRPPLSRSLIIPCSLFTVAFLPAGPSHRYDSVSYIIQDTGTAFHFFLCTSSAKQTSRLLLCLSGRMTLLLSIAFSLSLSPSLSLPLLCHFLFVTLPHFIPLSFSNLSLSSGLSGK